MATPTPPTTQPPPSKSPLEHTQTILTTQLQTSPIYAHLLSTLTLTSAQPGKIHATLPLAPHHLNSKGSVHGTVSACLVDWAAGIAIVSHGGDYTGVSTDIHVSYLGTARAGEVLQVQASAGKVLIAFRDLLFYLFYLSIYQILTVWYNYNIIYIDIFTLLIYILSFKEKITGKKYFILAGSRRVRYYIRSCNFPEI
ncbi:hypothetical protein BO71DRAFT_445159 [Aspergillus ellipticus CBS 707.79]|uniref:Thioesterase domain-containing protein n=1 Tax=Aspergillus ellipticus CBS 707.79 TaxID=1448320 RepID=A0A319CTC0_9EURO|nr:hypothetical protein BO71DRAFT_445159 [Aspergillus ellipticus CBS 707.79]